MELKDPVAVYNADSNLDAHWLVEKLESEGIAAYVIEDQSIVGQSILGMLDDGQKPQVFVERPQAEQAGAVILAFLEERRQRERAIAEGPDIDAVCEDCGKTNRFPQGANGTVQVCKFCNAYMDVGEFEWPDENMEGDDEHAG
jgi:hypothetical protein